MDNELLISKHLSGEMTGDESQAFADAGHDAAFRETLAWDRAVQDALTRDAASFPAFGIEPNPALLSKLATHSAAKTIFGLAASKVALLAGGAAVIGTAAYFIPRATEPVPMPQTHIIQPADTPSKPVATPAKPLLRREYTPATTQARQPAKPEKLPLRLNDEDDKNPPKITDPNYQPPVK